MMKKENVKGSAKDPVHPLEFALNFEVRGATMYLRLATSTENPLGKKLFYSLAAEEIEHAIRIDEIHADLRANRGWRSMSGKHVQTVSAQLRGFFLKSRKTDLKTGAANVQGYTLAMEMERQGYRTYREFHDAASTEAEKEFFRRLMAEEREHLDALANVYSYLTDTDNWLQEEESKVWNWMNI